MPAMLICQCYIGFENVGIDHLTVNVREWIISPERLTSDMVGPGQWSRWQVSPACRIVLLYYWRGILPELHREFLTFPSMAWATTTCAPPAIPNASHPRSCSSAFCQLTSTRKDSSACKSMHSAVGFVQRFVYDCVGIVSNGWVLAQFGCEADLH
jgi:hypothetical protein